MSGYNHHRGTNRSDSRSVAIDAPPAHVFAFLADPANLPRWAVGFCHSIRPDEPGLWVVKTAQGDVLMRYVVDEAAGTIDFHISPAPGVEVVAYSRVLPNGEGSEYVFTQFQHPGMSDDVFDGQVRALVEELQVLRGVIHARAECRV
jgi:hypothetical protein